MGKENTFNMEGIEYSVSLIDLNKFEKQNPSISIMVLGYEGKVVYPLWVSDNTERKHEINPILIEEDGVKHYCLVKSLSCLLSSQVSNHIEKHHFCRRCLNSFWTRKSLDKHLEYCNKHEAVKIQMPKEGTILKSLQNIKEGKRFLLSSTLTLSVIINRYNHVIQTLEVVISINTKNTNHLAFVIISNASMMMYMNQN